MHHFFVFIDSVELWIPCVEDTIKYNMLFLLFLSLWIRFLKVKKYSSIIIVQIQSAIVRSINFWHLCTHTNKLCLFVYSKAWNSILLLIHAPCQVLGIVS